MKVPFFDYPRLWQDDKNLYMSIIDETSKSGGFIMQEDLGLFEEELSNYIGCHKTIGVGNATDAMEIFLEAIGLDQGDEVIISSHTMLATASAIIMAGGVPIPVDIGEDNLVDPEAIEDAITPRTVGIMPTQLNGRTSNMDEINKIASKHHLFVVEDSAQALGSKFKNQHAGTFGLASCISFFPAKVVGCFGDAGSIIVNDQELYDKMYALRDHGRAPNGEVICWGRNSRLDNVQAAILRHKLRHYDSVIKRRRKIAELYHENLSSIEELHLPPPPSENSHNFDIYQNYELAAQDRDSLKIHLQEDEIGTLIQWGAWPFTIIRTLDLIKNFRKLINFLMNA